MIDNLFPRACMASRHHAAGIARPLAMVALTLAIQGCGGGGDGGGDVIPAFVSPANVVISDVNQDGELDLVVSAATVHSAPPHPGFVVVLTQKPLSPGTFTASVRFGAEFDPSGLALGALSGNGGKDIVLGSQNTKAGTLLPNNFVILRHDPSRLGSFLSPQLVPIGTHVINDVAVGDVNGDGRPDIVVTASPASAGPTVLVFTQSAMQPGTFVLSQSIMTATGSGAVALADLNGDGRLDIAVTASVDNGPGKVLVFMQDAVTPGTFLPATEYVVGLQPTAIAIGDLNGDGKPDLAVANQGAGNGSSPSMSVLLQDTASPGRFLNAVSYPSARAPMAIAISDIDGDGKLDIVTANASGAPPFNGSVQIYFQGQIRGAFGNPVRIGNFQGAHTMAVGDLNGDKAPDIVVDDGEGIAILFQNAQQRGQFLPAVHLAL
ncbi:FG-GAP repeat domain-containing protein [Cupriavidus sp. CuC1]|uniref:FG-GAP repeat domain-containing protein n=1 Tax=Cupriavidus sp. CuC1 TaxID=3373131 RepID=UPI0037CF88C6